jgi:RimJ/RimL family protein N-acetyltransferase
VSDASVFDPQPVTLNGNVVRLEPLEMEHAEALFAAAADPSIWTYLTVPQFKSLRDVRAWIEQSQAAQRAGTDLPFAVILKESGTPVGSTRFMDIRRKDRGLEIGWTWYAPAVQRTAVNTETKLLLFTHAFEQLGAVRVQLKTDSRNLRSQGAIERLGAVKEGVLRRHMLTWSGIYRDTVYYSVIAEEWPNVKERLISFLRR